MSNVFYNFNWASPRDGIIASMQSSFKCDSSLIIFEKTNRVGMPRIFLGDSELF